MRSQHHHCHRRAHGEHSQHLDQSMRSRHGLAFRCAVGNQVRGTTLLASRVRDSLEGRRYLRRESRRDAIGAEDRARRAYTSTTLSPAPRRIAHARQPRRHGPGTILPRDGLLARSPRKGRPEALTSQGQRQPPHCAITQCDADQGPPQSSPIASPPCNCERRKWHN